MLNQFKIQKTKTLSYGLIILGFALGVLMYETYLVTKASPQVFMEDGIAIFVNQNHQGVMMGEKPWFEDMVKGKAGTLFRSLEIKSWESLEAGNQYHFGDLGVLKWSDQVGLVDLGGSRFLVMLQEADDWEKVLGEAIDMETDFWVLWKNEYPENLPAPRKGIFLLSERTRKPTMLQLAREQELPFVWVKETGEITLEKRAEWKICANK